MSNLPVSPPPPSSISSTASRFSTTSKRSHAPALPTAPTSNSSFFDSLSTSRASKFKRQSITTLARRQGHPGGTLTGNLKGRGEGQQGGSSNGRWDLEDGENGEEEEEEDTLSHIMTSIVYLGGTDEELHPIVCLAASQLPDPTVISYDELLKKTVERLKAYVEQDYVLIFFAAASSHSPGWSWIFQAYRELGRSFRKNLKRLYLVHPTWWTKSMFALSGPLISPKFILNKLYYVSTLSHLATFVPLSQIMIPPASLKQNSLLEQSITLPTPTPSLQFGIPHILTMGRSKANLIELPRVIVDAVEFLRSNDGGLLETEGLFRRSASAGVLRCIVEAYDRGSPLDLASYADPHLAAVLIKKYFRDSPDPLFPESLYEVIESCPSIPASAVDPGCRGPEEMVVAEEAELRDQVAKYVREGIFGALGEEERMLFGFVVYLLHDVSRLANKNLMTSTNLALLMTPNLIHSSSIRLDLKVGSVPPSPSSSANGFPHPPNQSATKQPTTAKRQTTLGEVVRFCIDWPDLVFQAPTLSEDAVPARRAETTQKEGQDVATARPRREQVNARRAPGLGLRNGSFFEPPSA